MDFRVAQSALLAEDTHALRNFFYKEFDLKCEFTFYPVSIPYSFIFSVARSLCPSFGFGSIIEFGLSERAIIMHRILQIMPLLKSISQHCLTQTVWNMSDAGPANHVSFCSNAEALLVPDCEYLASGAYSEARLVFDQQPAWAFREDMPFWRGSTTGLRETPSIFDLPRVKLAALGRSFGYNFAVSNVVQATEEESQALSAAGLIQGHEPWHSLKLKKYVVDIDGNSSSWSGLFLKLLSGAAVMKVGSPQNYRQWYYDRLVPWFNFVPVRSDLSDLASSYEFLKDNQSMAEAIGKRGRALALSLTLERELAVAEETIFRRAGNINASIR